MKEIIITTSQYIQYFARYLTNILLKVQVDSESEDSAKRFTVYTLQYKIVHGLAERIFVIQLCVLFFLCKAKKNLVFVEKLKKKLI